MLAYDLYILGGNYFLGMVERLLPRRLCRHIARSIRDQRMDGRGLAVHPSHWYDDDSKWKKGGTGGYFPRPDGGGSFFGYNDYFGVLASSTLAMPLPSHR